MQWASLWVDGYLYNHSGTFYTTILISCFSVFTRWAMSKWVSSLPVWQNFFNETFGARLQRSDVFLKKKKNMINIWKTLTGWTKEYNDHLFNEPQRRSRLQINSPLHPKYFTIFLITFSKFPWKCCSCFINACAVGASAGTCSLTRGHRLMTRSFNKRR